MNEMSQFCFETAAVSLDYAFSVKKSYTVQFVDKRVIVYKANHPCRQKLFLYIFYISAPNLLTQMLPIIHSNIQRPVI